MAREPYDLCIVGGGINGCGIARDAAGRGLSVLLVEQSDLAGATSSASTKLIHGGLRYLEHYEFRLVREALEEREVLLAMAPHIVWPLRFVLPHHAGLRPAWLIRLGLFLYDHLGGRRLLPPTRVVDLRRDPVGEPLDPDFVRAFEYSDCWVDDARLVVLNAADAAERGARVRTRTQCVAAERADGLWRVQLEGAESGQGETVAARALVNAAGPWVADFIGRRVRSNQPARVRLVRGSHIIVPRLFTHDRAYIFQNADRRIVFVIPYEGDFTLIGTTDVDHHGDPGDVAATPDEIAYLCRAASGYLRRKVEPDTVVHTYSGVRPLYDDGAKEAREATRDYVLETDGGTGEPVLLNVFGGKITTYRRLAEAALERLADRFPGLGRPWTAGAPLPGGDFPVDGFADRVEALRRDCPAVPADVARRLVRAYGTRAWRIVEDVREEADLGRAFGAGLYAREVAYLMEAEWARGADDVLWRRSKLGLRLDAAAAADLDAWMRARSAARSAA